MIALAPVRAMNISQEISWRIPDDEMHYMYNGKYVMCIYEGDFEVVERYDYNSFLFTLNALGIRAHEIGEILWRLWKDGSFNLFPFIHNSDIDMEYCVEMEL